MLDLPHSLLAEIDALVVRGAFPSRDVAIVELIRLGLDDFRGRFPQPPRPPAPPGTPRDPGDDAPISVDPTDVNWANKNRQP